jgi:large conductance mechanosensitive channel
VRGLWHSRDIDRRDPRRSRAARMVFPVNQCPFKRAGVAMLPRPLETTGRNGMSFMSEFKEFAVKGNVIDLAVGVIIGGAFGKIVDSVVKDLIMPIVGAIFGGLDFSSKFILLGNIPPDFKGNPTSYADLTKAGVAVFGYGNFITVALNFLILAVIIFLMVKQINRLKRPAPDAPAAPAPTPEDIVLLREIRDSLKK